MMDLETLKERLPLGESIEQEFKSDRRKLSDREIYEEVVALANSSGGVLLLGVEDDGTVSGAQPRHGTLTDSLKLQAAIFNNTVPSINTRISVIPHPDGPVIAIEVDPYPEPCATASGKSLRRTIAGNGKPQSSPFYPRDQRSRRIDLGLLDFSAHPVDEATFDALDPLEFERLRQTITRLRGDQNLLDLSDEELAKALKLVETKKQRLVPNIAGLLLLGREESLRAFLPTHEVHFQVLDVQQQVKVNDAFHGPLLRTLENIEARFLARNSEQEFTVGLFRLPIPDYSPSGFREALNNAVLHRDYTQMQGVYVQWQPDHLLITNAGGFPQGVTLENLLVHEPKPRNSRLAESFKRIGLIEQTGRGVDKIYLGQLRYGRPSPDYSRSDTYGVRVVLRGGEASLQFAAFVFEQDQQGRPLTLDDLLVLNTLFFERQTDAPSTARLIQKDLSSARALLERLHERGLIERKGSRKDTSYHLSATLYQRFHMKAEYIRAKGFEPFQQEQMLLDYVKKHGRITRSEAADLCHLSPYQATRLLRKMADKYGEFQMVGTKKGAHYVWRETNI
jgi:ATP-dependent DNA helicase RecG